MFAGRGKFVVFKANHETDPAVKPKAELVGDSFSVSLAPEVISKHLLNRIERGLSTPIGLEVEPALTDSTAGVFAIRGMNNLIAFEPLSRLARSQLPEKIGHAMLVVGVIKNEQGQPEWWLLQDSYGRNQADGGYWHVRNDYLVEYWKSIFYFQNEGSAGAN
jgi:aminopeptidase C